MNFSCTQLYGILCLLARAKKEAAAQMESNKAKSTERTQSLYGFGDCGSTTSLKAQPCWVSRFEGSPASNHGRKRRIIHPPSSDCEIRGETAMNATVTLLTPAQVCAFLQVSPKTLQRLRMRRSLSYVRVRGQVRFRQSALENYLNKFTVRGTVA